MSIITCVMQLAKKFTTGSISVGNSVFFTRFVFDVIELVLDKIDSLNKVHGIIPQRYTTINGVSPGG